MHAPAGLLKAVLQPVDQVWMTDRFRIAACNRYRRLAAACDDQLPFSACPASPTCGLSPQLDNHNEGSIGHVRRPYIIISSWNGQRCDICSPEFGKLCDLLSQAHQSGSNVNGWEMGGRVQQLVS